MHTLRAPIGAALTAMGVCVAASCGGAAPIVDSPAPPPPVLFAITSGRDQTDTIEAIPRIPIVVTLRDSTGAPRRNVSVVATVVLPFDDPRIRQGRRPGTVSRLVTQSDSNGRAVIDLRFGTITGTWTLRVTESPVGRTDSLTFTVIPGLPARLTVLPEDSAAYIGSGYPLTAEVTDRGVNPLPANDVRFTTDSGTSVAAVSADGRVTASAIGRARLVAKIGTAVDTTRISVVPRGVLAVRVDYGSIDDGIARVNLDGSGFKLLRRGRMAWPSWSPNGEFVAYSVQDVLFRVDTNGVETKLSALGAYPWEGWPRYSYDGRYIYFTAGYFPDSLDTYRMAADGSGPRTRVTPARPGSMRYWRASPSPDGNTLAFSHAGFGVYLTTPGSGVERVVPTSRGGDSPRFSPDGAWLAYSQEYPTVVTVSRLDGSEAREVTPRGASVALWALDWSPDSQWIIYRGLDALHIVRLADLLDLPLPFARFHQDPSWRLR